MIFGRCSVLYKVSKEANFKTFWHYKPPSYNVALKYWINISLLTDAYSKSQESEKLTARRCGPFEVTEVIGNIAVSLDLSSHFRIHPVVHVVNTALFVQKPDGIGRPVEQRIDPIQTVGEEECIVDKISDHHLQGNRLQFPTLWRRCTNQDATWKRQKIL